MSLEHAILGFLRYTPFSGYDLKKAFDNSVRHFWPADQSQIYRTLARLAERGWAEIETVEQEDRPDRKVYHITEAGQEELRDWLTTRLPAGEVREPWLIQVFFAGHLSDEEVLDIFEHQAKQLRAKLERYHQIPQESASYLKVGSPREVFFWMLTLECGIRTTQAHLEWVESAIQRLKNKEYPPIEG